MSTAQPFLPSTLPLLPLPPPQVLYPGLQVTIPLSYAHLRVVLDSINQNDREQKVEESSRMVAVVPVMEIERRIGRWACAARIRRIEKSRKTDDTYDLTLEGLARIRLPRSLPPVLSILPPIPLTTSTFFIPLPSVSVEPANDLVPIAIRLLPPQLHERLSMIPPALLSDLLVTVLTVDWERRVELLGIPDMNQRARRVKAILSAYMESRGLSPVPEGAVSRPINKPPMVLIPGRPQTPSARPSSLTEDLQPLADQLAKRQDELSASAHQAVTRELNRLSKIPTQSAEYGVGRTYVEWLLALPWKKVQEVTSDLDLKKAKKQLDDEHEGLEAVKRRVVEYLAVYRLKRQLWEEEVAKAQNSKSKEDALPPSDAQSSGNGDASASSSKTALAPKAEQMQQEDGPSQDAYRDKGPILLLTGPPGVGKTSIARSLANSLGRKFHRISLGGVRDEAEIRGHRRTYVGALPGLLVQGLRKVGTSNPLILLDELDKVGSSSFHGDPSAALLETLDPAQNRAFHDHYLGDVPVDLSQVMFIATANTTDTISAPLLDRCEVIECSGYVVDEKLAIAKRFLLPKQAKENGLGIERISMMDDALLKVIVDYTREAGVRSLERELGKICRSKAVDWSSARDKKQENSYLPEVTTDDVERILGIAKFEQEIREENHRPGVVTGMAYRGSGSGGILLIESTLVPGGKGRLVTTGSLGDVISESASLALTWVRARSMALGITSHAGEDPIKDVDLHLHLPAGAVKKDGPSAGVAMVLAMVSLLTGRSIPSTTAVTGEITLRGAVTPVGGIKEKVIGAHRAGITKVILPARNRKDTQADLPKSLQTEINFAFVSTIEEALEEVWGRGIWKDLRNFKVEAQARL